MTLQELQEWIKQAKYYDTIGIVEVEDDWIGENTRIYILDGIYYAIDFYNTKPREKIGDKGIIRGEYPCPKKVELRSRVVTEWYFYDEEHDYDMGKSWKPNHLDVFEPPV